MQMGTNKSINNERKSVKFLVLRANKRNWYNILHFVEIKSNVYRDIGITSFFPLRKKFFRSNINHERFFHFLEIKRINLDSFRQFAQFKVSLTSALYFLEVIQIVVFFFSFHGNNTIGETFPTMWK